MERGKQRDADRIREAKERDEKQRQIRLAESKVISLNPGIVADDIDATAAPLLLKSKFVCIHFIIVFISFLFVKFTCFRSRAGRKQDTNFICMPLSNRKLNGNTHTHTFPLENLFMISQTKNQTKK